MSPTAIKRLLTVASMGAALVACERWESGPAPTGATAGSAGTPLQQRVYEQPHSGAVSAGTPTLSGGDTSGRPSVQRSGPGTGDLGGAPATSLRGDRSRGN